MHFRTFALLLILSLAIPTTADESIPETTPTPAKQPALVAKPTPAKTPLVSDTFANATAGVARWLQSAGAWGTDSCSGTSVQVTTASDCKAAAESLNLLWQATEEAPGWPAGCYEARDDDAGGVYWNTVEHDPCPMAVKVAGAEDVQSTRMGLYYKTNIAPLAGNAGRPIYANEGFKDYLYYWAEAKEWFIGTEFDNDHGGLHSADNGARQCPTGATEWRVVVAGEWSSSYSLTVGKVTAYTNTRAICKPRPTPHPTPFPTPVPPRATPHPTPGPTPFLAQRPEPSDPTGPCRRLQSSQYRQNYQNNRNYQNNQNGQNNQYDSRRRSGSVGGGSAPDGPLCDEASGTIICRPLALLLLSVIPALVA